MDNRNGAVAKPGESDLGYAAADLVRNFVDGSDDVIGALLLGLSGRSVSALPRTHEGNYLIWNPLL